MSLLILSVLLPLHAYAQLAPPDTEDRYRSALLAMSAHGDYDEAIATYQALIKQSDVRASPELHARILEALGQAYLTVGDYEAARDTLSTCIRVISANPSQIKSNCRVLSKQVALESGAVQSLPTQWTFDPDEQNGLVILSEQGTMRRERINGDHALVWLQELDQDQSAQLAMDLVLPPGGVATGVRLLMETSTAPAYMDVIVIDTQGRSYQARPFPIGETSRTYDIRMTGLTPRSPSWPVLDPASVASIRLRAFNPADEQNPPRATYRIVLKNLLVY